MAKDESTQHHHQHYYVEKPSPSAASVSVQNRKDYTYKPRIGEILAKDSVLYNSKTPVSSQQIRRNYWPLVDNTVTSLASNAAAGAAAVKNLLKIGFFRTFDNVNAAVEHKKHKIASYLIQAAQEHQFALQQAQEDEKQKQQMNVATGNVASVAAAPQHLPLLGQLNQAQHSLLPGGNPLHSLIPLKQKLAQNLVQHLSKHLKKPIKSPLIAPPWIVYSKTRIQPSTTVSEGYIHTYDNKYMPPNFEGPRARNPYADMGVTSYKHFEDTILKELEEKEERKVEATMHTLLEDDKYVFHESLEGTKPAISQEWQPFNSLSKPSLTIGTFTQSTFDRPFNDVRPVCEHLDEISVQPTLFVFPANAVESQLNELQEATNENPVSVKLTDPKGASNSTSSNGTSTEKPNYPAYFIKQQQELKKLQQKLVGAYRTKNHFNSINHNHNHNNNNKSTASRLKYSPYGRRTPTTATTTTITSTTAAAAAPTEMPVYYFSINGTDDGFRPMLPSEIQAMKIKKSTHEPSYHKKTSTRPKSSIQAQASHVQISVVSAPRDATTKRTKTFNKNVTKSEYVRKAPKKIYQPATSFNASTSTNQKTFRGAIKFSDSLHQSQAS